jgi:hypothetical protein
MKCIVLIRGRLKPGVLLKIRHGQATVRVGEGPNLETLPVPVSAISHAWSDPEVVPT